MSPQGLNVLPSLAPGMSAAQSRRRIRRSAAGRSRPGRTLQRRTATANGPNVIFPTNNCALRAGPSPVL